MLKLDHGVHLSSTVKVLPRNLALFWIFRWLKTIFAAKTTTLGTISGIRSTAWDAHEVVEARVTAKPVGTQLTVIAEALLPVGQAVIPIEVVPQPAERT